MKNTYFLLCILLSFTLHSMEYVITNPTSLKTIDDALENTVKNRALKAFKKKKLNITKLLNLSAWVTHSDTAVKEAIQEYRDKNNNNVIHLLVKYKYFDDLFICAERNMMVLEKNKKGQTPCDLAQEKFSHYINKQKLSDFKKENTTSCPERCCYFIVYNYMQAAEQKSYQFSQFCCDNHILLNKTIGVGEKQEI